MVMDDVDLFQSVIFLDLRNRTLAQKRSFCIFLCWTINKATIIELLCNDIVEY